MLTILTSRQCRGLHVLKLAGGPLQLCLMVGSANLSCMLAAHLVAAVHDGRQVIGAGGALLVGECALLQKSTHISAFSLQITGLPKQIICMPVSAHSRTLKTLQQLLVLVHVVMASQLLCAPDTCSGCQRRGQCEPPTAPAGGGLRSAPNTAHA